MRSTRQPARARFSFLLATASALALTGATAALGATARDDVGTDGSIDIFNLFPAVGQSVYPIGDTGFVGLCTGTLINPRTFLSAAHCFGDDGLGGSTPFGEGNGEVFAGDGIPWMVSFDVNTLDSIISWFGSGFQTGNGAYSATDVLIHPDNTAFPNWDIAMVALDTPIDHIDPMALLLDLPPGEIVEFPEFGTVDYVLTNPLHAIIVGYGNAGTGSEGITVGIDWNRRWVENSVPAAFGFTDFAGDPTPPLWIFDFDDPTGEVFPVDVLGDGGALPREGGTAGGDSGGPLIFDQLAPFPVVGGVLSGGGSLGPVENGYGDFSIYPMLALASDWIIANNPYKYVSALEGKGDWMDPHHWVQELDPGYYVFGKRGELKNGAPRRAPELELSGESAEGASGAEGLGGAEIDGAPAAIYDPGFIAATGMHVGAGYSGGGDYRGKPPLSGPGSTGFVPNNTDGAPSGDPTIEGAPAQYFDVTLTGASHTWLSDTVEIDRLTMALKSASSYDISALDIRKGGDLTVNLDTRINSGALNVDGRLSSHRLINGGAELLPTVMGDGLYLPSGTVSGAGTIAVDAGFYNMSGIVTAGDFYDVDTLTIEGDYAQGAVGALFVDVTRNRRNRAVSDLLVVSGEAALDGVALVNPVDGAYLAWGDRFKVIDAASVSGDFSDILLPTDSELLFATSRINSAGDVKIVIDAKSIADHYGSDHSLYSMGLALDGARWGGDYAALADVFSVIDSASAASLDTALFSVGPRTALDQTVSVASFTNSFTAHLANRSAELRAGARGLSARGLSSAALGLTPDHANADWVNPDMGDRLGVFIAARGTPQAPDMDPGVGYDYQPVTALTHSSGDLAVGVDFRLARNFAAGLAVTSSRYELTTNGVTPVDNDAAGAAAYATAYGKRWYVDGYAGIADQTFGLERQNIAFGGDSSIAYGAPSGTQSLAGLRAGWTMQPLRGLSIGPTATLAHSHLELDAYREAAGGDFNLSVDARDVISSTVESGMEFRYQRLSTRKQLLSVYGSYSMVSEFGDASDVVSAHFVDAPQYTFDLARGLDREWSSASAGMSFAFSRDLAANVQLNSDMGRGALSSHYASFGLDWRF